MTQAKSNKKPTLNRHVSFEDPAHSSASDDESKAVEVGDIRYASILVEFINVLYSGQL